MKTSTLKTIGGLAARSLAAVGVLERHGIDYCCGGNRPVDDVCREKGIEAEALIAEVAAAETSRITEDRDWSKASLMDLIGHILSTHHVYLRRELPLLSQRLDAVNKAHAERHGEMLSRLSRIFSELREELESHMQKEEVVLFPFVERAEKEIVAGAQPVRPPFGAFQNPINVMEHEHQSAGNALAAMRQLTGQYELPADACNTFRALFDGLRDLERDLHIHIHLENNILFPRAVEMEGNSFSRLGRTQF
jgi:regulator of cell morphogenesis and NO signaling